MKTPLCTTLGIDLPIMQAAIGGISCPALAAAVSNAGGLGAIAMTGYGADGVTDLMHQMQDLTSAPFVGNLLLSFDIEDEFRALLRNPPKVFSFFWGDITSFVQPVHDAGALVMASVGSIEEAGRAVEAGADIIVAQGWEAGGHVRGTTATLPLIPQVVDAVAPVPVVAAGGIADGRGLAAVLCLGAQAAWMGTRFLSAEEAAIHPHYRNRVLNAETKDTFLTTVFDRNWPDAPGRVLYNDLLAAWEAAGRPDGAARPRAADIIATTADNQSVHAYEAQTMHAGLTGEIEAGPLWAGQSVGLVERTEPAAKIIETLVNEAQDALSLSE